MLCVTFLSTESLHLGLSTSPCCLSSHPALDVPPAHWPVQMRLYAIMEQVRSAETRRNGPGQQIADLMVSRWLFIVGARGEHGEATCAGLDIIGNALFLKIT